MTGNRHIIVFVKNNQPGKVKTRIAASLGDAVASKIYAELCTTTRLLLESQIAICHVYYSDFTEEGDEWDGPFFLKKCQRTGDLGRRMSAACKEVLSQYDVQNHSDRENTTNQNNTGVLIIGTDCPYLTVQILETAWQILSTHDVVIGPAADGGYYLIGMKEWRTDLFALSAWSTPTVCEETISIIHTLNLTYETLPVLEDIDTADDWRKYVDSSDRGRRR